MDLEPLHPLQVARFRSMTPEEKYAIVKSLQRTAREVRRAAYRHQHPDWTPEEVDRAVAQEFARART